MTDDKLTDRLDVVLSKLMISVLVERHAIVVKHAVGYMYVLRFSESRDAKYIAWNTLEHIPENYFTTDEVENILTRLLKTANANTMFLSLEDLNKLVCLIESLCESGEINEWQCSDKTIKIFNTMYPTLDSSVTWHQKFNAMQHLEVWTADEVASILGEVEHKLNTDMGIPSMLLSVPLEQPYVCKVQINDARDGVNLMRRVRKHDSFNKFSKECIISFEQFVTDVPTNREGAMLTFNYDNMKVFSDIVLDL